MIAKTSTFLFLVVCILATLFVVTWIGGLSHALPAQPAYDGSRVPCSDTAPLEAEDGDSIQLAPHALERHGSTAQTIREAVRAGDCEMWLCGAEREKAYANCGVAVGVMVLSWSARLGGWTELTSYQPRDVDWLLERDDCDRAEHQGYWQGLAAGALRLFEEENP